MSEPRAPYGPELRFKITISYHLALNGNVTVCGATMNLAAKDAAEAGHKAIATVEEAVPAGSKLTNIWLNVAIDK